MIKLYSPGDGFFVSSRRPALCFLLLLGCGLLGCSPGADSSSNGHQAPPAPSPPVLIPVPRKDPYTALALPECGLPLISADSVGSPATTFRDEVDQKVKFLPRIGQAL